ncbi:MFS transporter [Nonomuraea sp. NPDC059007]|uniref:MFS transporter n=1 Tax=Nonomuraea sp. NPDC059007 TaxID=3346692 RepID=UPI0036C31F84
MKELLLDRTYRRLWLGQSVSLAGDYLFTTTMALWIGTVLLRDQPYAPSATAASLLIVAVVTVAGAPVAGALVDRWDKVRVARTADAVRTLIGGGFAILAWLAGSLPVGLTLALCGLALAGQSAATQFFNPARIVILSDVVSDDRREQAASFAQASSAIAMIAGPALAGALFAAAGPGVCFGLNAATFACSFLALRGTRVPMTEARERHLGREMLAPLRLLARDRTLRAVLGAGMIVMLGASAFGSLNVFFVRENLSADPAWFGVISSALGAGILTGALGSAALHARLGKERLFAGGLLLCGLTCLVYARLDSAPLAALVIFGYGVAGGIVETVMSPILLAATGRDHLARVLSVFTSALRLASITSLGLVGWLAGGRGRIDLILLGAAVMFLLAGAHAALYLRRPGPEGRAGA